MRVRVSYWSFDVYQALLYTFMCNFAFFLFVCLFVSPVSEGTAFPYRKGTRMHSQGQNSSTNPGRVRALPRGQNGK